VQGYARQRARKEVYRGAERTFNYVPKLKRDIAVEEKADELAEVIMRSAYTGRIGDGKIFIFNLASARRIRTRESAARALLHQDKSACVGKYYAPELVSVGTGDIGLL
jgi:nitrogen regulatory protein PII